MKMTKLLFWRKPASEFVSEPAAPPLELSSNVIRGSFGDRAPQQHADGSVLSPVSEPLGFKGMLEAPELKEFMDLPHFGRGRTLGASTRSFETMELGERELVAEFQNRLLLMAQRRRAKRNRLERELGNVTGISEAIAAELRLACEHLDQEIGLLEQQKALASESKGWVLEPLNSFRAGVHRGVREAVDFLLLSA